MGRQDKALKTFSVYARARDIKGVTDYWVSKQANVRPSMICDWKHGRYTPKIDKLMQVAKVLDIPLEMFVEG